MWLTDLAKLADPKYGLTVVFEPGWRTRGASGGQQMKAVKGALWHHDVAPRSGTYPLRWMLRNGRPGLSGPLAHIGFDRDGVVHVIGAGKANHAGTGKVPGVVRNGGNTRLLGIEMTSAGTRPWDWTSAQLRQMPKLGAALGDIFGYGPDENWAHYEYSDGGKIDPAGLPGAMPGLRSRIAAVSFPGGIAIGGGAGVPRPLPTDPARPWRTSPRVAGMTRTEVREIQQTLLDLGYDLGRWGTDGSYGDATGTAVKQLQQDLDITADGVYGPGTERALMSKLDRLEAIVTVNQGEIREARDYAKRAVDIVTVNQRRIGRIPDAVLDEPIKLAGIHTGQTSNLRTKAAYEAHNFTQAHRMIAASQTAVLEAIQETARAQGLTDEQVQQIATAAAEASARVSAEDVAALLDVTVREA